MQIRNAELSDLPAMLHIYNDAIRNMTTTFDLKEQTLEERRIWFDKYGDNFPLIVAEIDGEVAGYSCLSKFRDKLAYSASAELSVYISKKYRGNGIGSSLMKEILQRAKNLNYHAIVSGITGGNEPSVNLHRKFGFEFVGSFKEIGFKFGEWHDVHFYQHIIRD